MTSRVLLIAVIVIAALAGPRAQVRGEVALRAATELETVKGDLKGAIEAYRKIVEGYPKDRAVQAQALLRMADVYRRLGDQEATRVYQRLVRDFSDQPQVAGVARTRLKAPVNRSDSDLPRSRMLWAAPQSFYYFSGNVSADGTALPYIDAAGEKFDLNVYDVPSGVARTLVRGGRQASGRWEAPEVAAISRDGQWIAYEWNIDPPKGSTELRIVSAKGSSTKPRTLISDPSLASIVPTDWLPGDRQLLVQVQQRNGTRAIGVVDAETGSMRKVAELPEGARGSWVMSSPTGDYAAYDAFSKLGNTRDIYTVSLKDGRVSDLAHPAEDTLVGWTPDGGGVVFLSFRTGRSALWRAPVANGVLGEPVLVKADVSGDGAGISSAGNVFYTTSAPRMTDIFTMRLDAAAGTITAPPAPVDSARVGGSGAPRWSPDGRTLGYIVSDQRRKTLVLRDEQSRDARELVLPIRDFRNGNRNLWRWTSDGRGILVLGADTGGKAGIHRIDVNTGKVAWSVPLDDNGGGVNLPHTDSEDVVQFTLWKNPTRDFTIRERNVLTGQGRDVYRSSDDCRVADEDPATLYCAVGSNVVRRSLGTGADIQVTSFETGRWWSVSPEGRFVATSRSIGKSRSRTVWVTDTRTGQTRQLLVGVETDSFDVRWIGRSEAAIVVTADAATNRRIAWWVPLARGDAKRLRELDGSAHTGPVGLQLTADGRLAYEVEKRGGPTELWVLENTLRK